MDRRSFIQGLAANIFIPKIITPYWGRPSERIIIDRFLYSQIPIIPPFVFGGIVPQDLAGEIILPRSFMDQLEIENQKIGSINFHIDPPAFDYIHNDIIKHIEMDRIKINRILKNG